MADEAHALRCILAEAIETLLEYGKTHKGQSEGLMAYDVLLTMQENAEVEDISLEDIGLTRKIVDSLI